MTNIWDASDYLVKLYSLWIDLRACRELGVLCQSLSLALIRPALFDAGDMSAYDTIMDKIKAEGLSILTEGGARVLTPDDVQPTCPGWLE